VFYQDIRYGHQTGVDIKVPWELSRFQHLTTLGQAFLITKNTKYSDEYRNEIIDWTENNPVGFGVNWKTTMEVAIRASNWLVAMEYFSKTNPFTVEFLTEFYRSVYEHGRFIRAHLEYSPFFKGNHYLSNIVGLMFIAIYCPFFKEARKWLDFCKREIEREMQNQVYDDGCNFEASTSYHRLVLELFFFCETICERANIHFSSSYKSKLRKMFDFSLYCIKPNGMIPQIGDNDSGRFIVFGKRPILDQTYLLNWAAIRYKESRFKRPEYGFDEESFWIFGWEGASCWNGLPCAENPLGSRAFPHAGWFVLRDTHDYCFISCGPNGQNGKGGHAHNDKLSFELMLNGRDVIVDPGTYVYTSYPEERNKFRATAHHNTIKFNDCEQNPISNSLFYLSGSAEIIDTKLEETDREVRFEGAIRYNGVSHCRIITLDKRSGDWRISDNLSSAKPRTAQLLFHLAPGVTYDPKESMVKESETEIAFLEVRGRDLEGVEYDYSPEYGAKAKSEMLTTKAIEVMSDLTLSTCIRRTT
ncbi:MAG: hypothetical protein GTO24_11665, partial [candidate division Zixibacteria bacterium]|nr:hypothetical protein [candidate division Zixibacteria bacterium]